METAEVPTVSELFIKAALPTAPIEIVPPAIYPNSMLAVATEVISSVADNEVPGILVPTRRQ